MNYDIGEELEKLRVANEHDDSHAINNYTNSNGTSLGKTKDLAVLPEIIHFRLPDDAKSEISKLYTVVVEGKIKRNAPRRGIIYCCVVAICKKKDLVFDKTEIQNSLNLKLKDINKATKDVESKINRYLNPQSNAIIVNIDSSNSFNNNSNNITHNNTDSIDPSNLPLIGIRDVLRSLIHQLDLQESCLNDILTIYEVCKKVSPLFNSAKYETLAAGLLYYYISEQGKILIDRGLADNTFFNEEYYFEVSKVSKDSILAVSADVTKYYK